MTHESKILKERIGRLQSVGLPFLIAIAKTAWLAPMLIDFLSQVIHQGYRRLFRVRAEFTAQFGMMVGDFEVKFRAMQESGRPGTLCALRVVRV